MKTKKKKKPINDAIEDARFRIMEVVDEEMDCLKSKAKREALYATLLGTLNAERAGNLSEK